MSLFDTLLIVLLGGFALFGFWFGFIHVVGSIASVIVGFWAAGYYYDQGAAWLIAHSGLTGPTANFTAFLVIFGLARAAIGIGFWLLEKLFKIVAIIPFLKTFNRLGGALLGLAEGVFVVGLILHVATRFSINWWGVGDQLKTSSVAPTVIATALVAKPLLPEVLRQVQAVLPK